MSNYPAPTNDSAISGLHPISVPLTLGDLLIISVKIANGYYTGRINLEQIKEFFLDNTTALEISGLAGLLDKKANVQHSHLSSDITDLPQILSGKANAQHSHNANQIVGLNSLLDGKANVIHVHEMTSISGLISALSGKANTVHVHEITEVMGLKQKLDELEAWTTAGGSNHTHQIDQVVGLQIVLDDKANVRHNHSMDEVSGLALTLSNKADVQHTHSVSDISDFQTSLDGKANSIHTHQIFDIDGLADALSEKAGVRHQHSIDDVENLRSSLEEKAPKVHNHTATSIEGLDLALANKSDLDHQHDFNDIPGLDLALAEKTNTGHKHKTEDIEDLQLKLDEKANTQHTQPISSITGLQDALNASEKISNKVDSLDSPSTVKYPTVNAVTGGIYKALAEYNYPVMTVNGMMGEVVISKLGIGLSEVDNTSDINKPVSNPTREALGLKVDRRLAGYQEHRTKGRIENSDDYVAILEKLQWQLDIARGIIPEPPVNLITLAENGHELLISFERPVNYLSSPLEDVDLSLTNIFQATISSDLLDQVGGINHQNIETQVTDTTVIFKLKPGWIRAENMSLVDSTDHGGLGKGILKGFAEVASNYFSSIDGGLISPSQKQMVPFLMYTHLSEFDVVHSDVEYSRVEVLGVWGDTPIYDYVSPEIIIDIDTIGNKLSIKFSKAVLFKGEPLANYVGTPLELIKDLFVPRPELDLLDQALVESNISTTITDRLIELEMKPGFFDKLVFEMLDSPAGGYNGNGDGIYKLLATINRSMFDSVTGDDIIVTRSLEVRLTSYTNMSGYTTLHTPADYAKATIVGVWDDMLSYSNIPAVPVENMTGGYNAG